MNRPISHLSGMRLRRARCDADMSQADLALALDVPVGLVQQWETGAEPADLLTLTAVSVVTGCNVDTLREGAKVSAGQIG